LLPLNDGNILLYGVTSGHLTYCEEYYNVIRKIDPSGNILFEKKYGQFNPEDLVDEMREMQDGSFIMSAVAYDSVGTLRMPYLLHLDSTGALLGKKGFDYNYPTPKMNKVKGNTPDPLVLSSVYKTGVSSYVDTAILIVTDTALNTTCNSLPITIIELTLPSSTTVPDISVFSFPFTFVDTAFNIIAEPAMMDLFDACTILTVPDESNINIRVFPNPVSDYLNIEGDLFDVEKYHVSNAAGKVIYSEKINNSESNIKINVQGLNAGIYFIQLDSRSGPVRIRFIKM
jgi:hypothetical protein